MEKKRWLAVAMRYSSYGNELFANVVDDDDDENNNKKRTRRAY